MAFTKSFITASSFTNFFSARVLPWSDTFNSLFFALISWSWRAVPKVPWRVDLECKSVILAVLDRFSNFPSWRAFLMIAVRCLDFLTSRRKRPQQATDLHLTLLSQTGGQDNFYH